jgi:hypothetical protein
MEPSARSHGGADCLRAVRRGPPSVDEVWRTHARWWNWKDMCGRRQSSQTSLQERRRSGNGESHAQYLTCVEQALPRSIGACRSPRIAGITSACLAISRERRGPGPGLVGKAVKRFVGRLG